MNLRRDTWLTGALILLCCSSFVKTQERNVFVTDTGFFTGLGNIASLVLGVGVGFILKQCPDCPEPTPSLSCPDGFTAKTPEGESTRCYKYEETTATFEDASVACAALAPGDFRGHLSAIETDAESDAINEFIDSLALGLPTFIWLGASDLDGDGIYLWNTYQFVTQSVTGGNACLNILSSNKSFFSNACDFPRAYICESKQT